MINFRGGQQKVDTLTLPLIFRSRFGLARIPRGFQLGFYRDCQVDLAHQIRAWGPNKNGNLFGSWDLTLHGRNI